MLESRVQRRKEATRNRATSEYVVGLCSSQKDEYTPRYANAYMIKVAFYVYVGVLSNTCSHFINCKIKLTLLREQGVKQSTPNAIDPPAIRKSKL